MKPSKETDSSQQMLIEQSLSPVLGVWRVLECWHPGGMNGQRLYMVVSLKTTVRCVMQAARGFWKKSIPVADIKWGFPSDTCAEIWCMSRTISKKGPEGLSWLIPPSPSCSETWKSFQIAGLGGLFWTCSSLSTYFSRICEEMNFHVCSALACLLGVFIYSIA